MHVNKPLKNHQTRFGVQSISTRQQWLGTLNNDIDRLTKQQQSLITTLNQHQLKHVSDAKNLIAMGLQQELGEIQRKLTLAQENLSRATQWSS